MSGTHRWQAIAAATLLALLAACANDQARRDSVALIDQGRYEEGLAKFEQAGRDDPNDLSYRTALKNYRDMAVNRLLAAGEAERRANHPDAARAQYERALRIDPASAPARTGLDNLARDQRHAQLVDEARAMLKTGDMQGAKAALQQVLLENPDNAAAAGLKRQLDEQTTKALLAEPALLAKFKKPVTLQFRDANLKMVFEALARTSGINILLDKDVRPDLKTSIFVKDVSVEDTIDLILLQNQLEKKVLSDNTVFVYPNTPAKQKDYQDLKVRSFHLVNADAKQMLTLLKTILKTKDIFVHERTNSIVIRDTPDAVRLAEKLIADQDGAEPEAMIDVEVLEVTRTGLTNLGVQWPDQLVLTAVNPLAISAASAASAAGSTSTTGTTGGSTTPGLTLKQLNHLNTNNVLVSPALSLAINLHEDHSDINLLASPRIRVKNKEKAKIMIGDRVPVITNAVTPVSTGTPVVTGSVQYLDVGLKLDVEPTINPDNEVSMKVGLEVSSIVREITNPQSGTTAYDVGTRNATTVLTLKDGQTQILGGLINDSDKHTVNEVPLLGTIPLLGHLFASHKNDTSKTEIVLSITPHIVRPARQPEAGEVEYWSGTESTVRSSPLTLKPVGTVSLSSGGTPSPARPGTPPPLVPVPTPAVPPASPTGPAPQSGDPMNLSWTGPNHANVGDRIALTLGSASPRAVTSLGFLVNYDPTVLKAVDVAEGTLLKQGDPAATFAKDIQPEAGHILVDLAGQPVGRAPVAGTAATITFEVLAASPHTLISVSQVAPAGEGGQALPVLVPEPFALTLAQPSAPAAH